MFWIGLLCLALAVICAILTVTRAADAAAATFILIAIFALSWTIASYNRVPTKNVGIVTRFGKPTGKTTGAGLEWTKPWENVEDWDASGQQYNRLGDHCLWVSIAAQRRACIAVQVEWNANPASAPDMWASYKATKEGESIDDDNPRFGTFIYRRVNPQIDGAITSVFAGFDPLGAVKANGDAAAPDLNADYRTPLLVAINGALRDPATGRDDITVKSIVFGTPTYDPPTTAAIAAYGQKMLEARNLRVDQQNAATRREVAASTGIPAAVQQCLDIAQQTGKEPGLCVAGATPVKQVG